MAKTFVLCVLLSALHIAAGGLLKNVLGTVLMTDKFSHFDKEISEWKRLHSPLELVFHHLGNTTANARVTELPPESSDADYDEDMSYYLFTRDNPERTQVTMDLADLINAGYSANRPTKIVIHGFANNIGSELFLILVPALLINGDYNVLAVDWGKLSRPPWYIEARYHVESVGKHVAELVNLLSSNNMLDLNDLHLIGHSLGSHVAGTAGKHVKSGTVGRITGLEPALPLFLFWSSERLHKDDARTVDVLHTCGGVLGYADPLGHVDFFANGGGPPQPGCGVDLAGTCSHGNSFRYYAESCRYPTAFKSAFCQSKDDAKKGACNESDGIAYMSCNLRFDKPGRYYFKTADSASPPYSLNTEEANEANQ